MKFAGGNYYDERIKCLHCGRNWNAAREQDTTAWEQDTTAYSNWSRVVLQWCHTDA